MPLPSLNKASWDRRMRYVLKFAAQIQQYTRRITCVA
jgi:hypothetical protein